jgi:hypothetical protein
MWSRSASTSGIGRERLVVAEERAPAQPGRQMGGDAEEHPRQRRRGEAGAEDAELRLLELVAAEGERRNQE